MQRFARFLSALAFSAMFALPSASSALTLSDLNAGASFSTTGGEVSFDFAAGSIALAGALPLDLSQYTVVPTTTGFIVSGPLAALGPAAFGVLALAYQVSAGAGFALTSAGLQASGLAFGPGAFAIASSGLSNGAGLGLLFASGGGTGSATSASFASTGALSALSGVQLFALTPGDVASIASLHFSFGWVSVPEPVAGLLLALGLGGLALFARRGVSAQ